MRALILTGFSSHDLGPLVLADEQIIAGPDWPDAQTVDGCWNSLRTPVGEYDLAEMLAKIPARQQPDVVICLVGAAGRGVPSNIAAFQGQKVLLVADTPDFGAAACGELPVATVEPYDRVVFLSDLNVPVSRQPGAAAGGAGHLSSPFSHHV